jgi:hypothetical protein
MQLLRPEIDDRDESSISARQRSEIRQLPVDLGLLAARSAELMRENGRCRRSRCVLRAAMGAPTR